MGITVQPAQGTIPGVRVTEVGGRARRAGLGIGDVVTAVDGKPTPTLENFRNAAQGANRNRGVLLDTVRDGQPQVVIIR